MTTSTPPSDAARRIIEDAIDHHLHYDTSGADDAAEAAVEGLRAAGLLVAAPPLSAEDAARLVFEALGTASVCWDPRPAGVFESDRAAQVGRDLLVALGYEVPVGYHDRPPAAPVPPGEGAR